VRYRKGDLVHIPQAVYLFECDGTSYGNKIGSSQVMMPFAIKTTASPVLGVVTEPPDSSGFVQVYSDGHEWLVKSQNIYIVRGDKG
tara:strand:- start:218 stop:475 length:258 start_codon:yes stop_codon:yes gene_type:complete